MSSKLQLLSRLSLLLLATATLATGCVADFGADEPEAVDAGPDDDTESDQELTCEPLSCLDVECGSYEDGCGGMLDCGACSESDPTSLASKRRDYLTFATANIGRASRARTRLSVQQVKNTLAAKTPASIGWQEITEGNECKLGTQHPCERGFIRSFFPSGGSWKNLWMRNDQKAIKVPMTLKGLGSTIRTRRIVAHGPAGSYGTSGSARRFITVAYSPKENISFVNTHLISAAWNCKKSQADRKKRRRAWNEGWANVKKLIAQERGRGRNVVFTADLNRSQKASSCNPAWKAAPSLNSKAGIAGAIRINSVAGQTLDYIIAVPAPGQRWNYDRRASGAIKRGKLSGNPMEGFHTGYWVRGRFLPQ